MKVFVIVAIGALFGCATIPKQNKWEELRFSPEFQRERQIYKQKIGDREICWETSLSDMLEGKAKPTKECIYPISKMSVIDGGFVSEKMNLKHQPNQLKVFQVTPEGFLVEPAYTSQALIFIYNSGETDIIDGSFLDQNHTWNMYEYAGPYSYKTLAGSRTVHSFKRVSSDLFANARKDLKLYDPKKEFLIYNKLWDWLEE